MPSQLPKESELCKQAAAWCDMHCLLLSTVISGIVAPCYIVRWRKTSSYTSVVCELRDTLWVIIPYRVLTHSSSLLKPSHFCNCENPCGDGTKKHPPRCIQLIVLMVCVGPIACWILHQPFLHFVLCRLSSILFNSAKRPNLNYHNQFESHVALTLNTGVC